MPLYWYTDKIIADKYALIKPIPLKAEFESCEGWWMDFPVSDINNEYRESEEDNIKLIENNLDEFIEKGYVRKIDKQDQVYIMSLITRGAFKPN